MGTRDAVVAKIQSEGIPIQPPAKGRMKPQRLQLGTEQECLSLPPVIERFLPHAIPGQEDLPGFRIPQREGEHAPEPVHGGPHTPLLDGRQHDLSI